MNMKLKHMKLKHKFVVESKDGNGNVFKKLIVDTFEKFCDLKPRPKSIAREYFKNPDIDYHTYDYTLRKQEAFETI
jgi:hypothetical protein